MLLTVLFYIMVYFLSFITIGMILSFIAALFTGDIKSGSKIGANVTSLIYLCFFIYYLTVANPLGVMFS